MNAHPVLLQMKYARVVSLFAKQAHLSLDQALAFFYSSNLYQLLKKGVSDIHCMSDPYLVEDLQIEFSEKSLLENMFV
jgi:hypothetical protein